jgi:hypothetical protein
MLQSLSPVRSYDLYTITTHSDSNLHEGLQNYLYNNFFYYYCIFTIYSRYIKRVISKRDGCEYLKQVPSIDGSLALV